jgi:hypothetical protein
MATSPRRRARATAPPSLATTADTGDDTTAVAVADAPHPQAQMAVWMRAAIRLPDTGEIWRDCKIYATPDGLYVYRSVPADGWTPDWWAPMPPQPRPITGVMARNGFNLVTDKGAVIITPSTNCACSAPLRRFNPDFAQRVVKWVGA